MPDVVDDFDVDRSRGLDISLVTGFIVNTFLGLHVFKHSILSFFLPVVQSLDKPLLLFIQSRFLDFVPKHSL